MYVLANRVIIYHINKPKVGNMKFSEKVKTVRGILQLTQKQLGEKLGVQYYTVNRWEKGHHEPTFLVRHKFDEFCKQHNIKFEEVK